MNNADRRRIANCFDRLTKLTYPASGVPMRPDRLREAIRKERALAMEIMGEDCDCAEPAEPREGGTVEVKTSPIIPEGMAVLDDGHGNSILIKNLGDGTEGDGG